MIKLNCNKSQNETEIQVRKLRERSADSTLYTLPGHSVEKPRTLTITSLLPNPRKGNPGTVKTTVVARVTHTLDEGSASERNVHVICKLETSFPVGCNYDSRAFAADVISIVLRQTEDNFDRLLYSGILPEEQGSDEDDQGGAYNGVQPLSKL